MGNVNLFTKSLAILAVTFGLMACNGGSDSEDLVKEVKPAVSVEGLDSGDSVSVGASFSSDDLTFNSNTTKSFKQELLSSENYQLSLSVSGASNCAFGTNRKNNLESSDPTSTDRILCNDQLQSANQGDQELEANSIGLALMDADGNDIGTAENPVTGSTPAEARATVVGPEGNPVEQKAVEFSLQGQEGSVGVLDPASGSAVTNNSGVASITVRAGEGTGASSLVATAEVDGEQLQQSIDFQVNAGTTGGGGAVDQLALDLVDVGGNAIGTAADPITESVSGNVQATVTGPDGNPVKGTVVSFETTNSVGSFASEAGTALTDANGLAEITLEAGEQSGAGTLVATTTVQGQELEQTLPSENPGFVEHLRLSH